MKKKFFFIFLCSSYFASYSQKCLDISVSKLMNKLEIPETSASSFKKCTTEKNDHAQITITNYGSDLVQLDTMIVQTTRNFNYAYAGVATSNTQIPTQQDISAAKDLATQLKNMTPEQQKEFAMQMAQQQQKNMSHATMQDDAATSKLVFQTNDIAVNQMKFINDDFVSKLRNIDNDMAKEIQSVKKGDKSKCPQGITGLPSCDCANEIEGKYWQQVVTITDNYNNQKKMLLQTYLSKLKLMAETVDNNIITLKKGDAIKSSNLKNMLFSAQSAAFGNAFTYTTNCIENIRKTGADAFDNKVNCDAKVYDISCYKK